MNGQANWTAINEQYLKAAVSWIRLSLQQLTCSVEPPALAKDEEKGGWFRRTRHRACSDIEGKRQKLSDREAVEQARQEMNRLEATNPSRSREAHWLDESGGSDALDGPLGAMGGEAAGPKSLGR